MHFRGALHMKNEQQIREIFISNAIHLIGEGGFEKATTKELTNYQSDSHSLKMNEAYIYRVFGSKEAIYEAAFVSLDQELYDAILGAFNAVNFNEGDVKEKFYEFFSKSWRFMMKNEKRCRCYVRYYYSIYFKGSSLQGHNAHFENIVTLFAPLFREKADVNEILHSVFTSLLDFSVRVHNCDLANTPEVRHHVFNILYCMLATYLK